MNALAIRVLLALGLAAALFAGYHALAAHQQGIGYDRAQAEYAQQAKKTDDKRDAVAAPIEAAHQVAAAKIVTITKTIIKEVPTYVKTTDCPMPGGFRVLHDAAANGQVPEPARIATATAVPAPDVAATVAANYGTCLETAERLTALQAWVRAQQDLKQ